MARHNKITKLLKVANNSKYPGIKLTGLHAIAANPYVMVKVPTIEVQTSGHINKGYFTKAFVAISEEGKIFYKDTTEAKLEQLEEDMPDVEQIIPDGDIPYIQLNLKYLRQLLDVFNEQKVYAINIHAEVDPNGLLVRNKAVKITGSGVTGVIMPMSTKD